MVWVGQQKGMSDKENSEWATPTRKGRHLIPCKRDQHLRAPPLMCLFLYLSQKYNCFIIIKCQYKSSHSPKDLRVRAMNHVPCQILSSRKISHHHYYVYPLLPHSAYALGMSLHSFIIIFSTINPKQRRIYFFYFFPDPVFSSPFSVFF